MMQPTTINVCFVTDEKPGHKNQLLGLEQSLKLQVNIVSQWVSVSDVSVSWGDVLFKRLNLQLSQVPDIVVGAGSATHKLVLAIKRKFKCFSVLLMKPSLIPISCFDALVIPEHDNPPDKSSIYKSCGVLNKVRPRDPNYQPTRNGLILIGGQSKHFQWDSDSIWQQVRQIVSDTQDVDHWVLGDSRRTPQDFKDLVSQDMLSQDLLSPKLSEQLTYVRHDEVSSDWLPTQMAQSDRIWITPDSVSMVYEALTSGAETGVLELQAPKQGRIQAGLEKLINDGLVRQRPDQELPIQKFRVFCEADKSAEWIIGKYLGSKKLGND
ncbi:mitochondrial fission ELM1 family protein [Litoribrevibacter euphylliae]|uniref:Mitochondrial fission ELM1 family protein n=1 Tax=Litoribrevibacter euphylliae TaxID=1834034 RepID=A0ABV7HJU4_9GAMM